jgi:hypothetical protein
MGESAINPMSSFLSVRSRHGKTPGSIPPEAGLFQAHYVIHSCRPAMQAGYILLYAHSRIRLARLLKDPAPELQLVS